jgi:hypothetical protein
VRARELFCRLFLTRLTALHDAGQLAFFGAMTDLADRRTFLRHLAPVRKRRWVVYAKQPFAGPEAVLAYLPRCTHRIAISNRRLVAFDGNSVTFRRNDYRREGAERHRIMTLATDEFIRCFLLHVLPRGFHRTRHYGLVASAARKDNLALAPFTFQDLQQQTFLCQLRTGGSANIPLFAASKRLKDPLGLTGGEHRLRRLDSSWVFKAASKLRRGSNVG